ncbi:MmcQ/YjbR family DNA-binding protein [Propionibacteriaceae bacterium G1746]|uniref:MmcQ/YjbR family DNA-binding protein n=1 Tax=Aestuariimicrobium sp. G57 TaxID=3418485 RepID=UPI003C26BF29
MAHPQMFDDDDPVLARVREICLALPQASVKISHGRPAFFTKKVFTYYGGSIKVDGEWLSHDQSIMVLPDPDDAEALRQDPRAWVPGYLGPYGWLGIDIDLDADWDEVAELVTASYLLTAPAAARHELQQR